MSGDYEEARIAMSIERPKTKFEEMGVWTTELGYELFRARIHGTQDQGYGLRCEDKIICRAIPADEMRRKLINALSRHVREKVKKGE